MFVPAEFLKTLQVVKCQEHENLSIFPLISGDLKEPGYLLLDEALDLGAIDIGEANVQGIVNEILIHNRSDRPVLILDGEILSYALDALGTAGREKKAAEAGAVRELLDRMASSEVKTYHSMGLGEDIRLKARELTGSCLAVDGKAIHLAFFAEAGQKRLGSRISRPSRRRNRQV